jgi:hypothetical protein
LGHILFWPVRARGQQDGWFGRALVVACIAACASAGSCARSCPSGAFCGVATWVARGDEPIVEGTSVVLLADEGRDLALGADANPEALALRRRPVFLRFDLAPLRSRGSAIERATLLLAPHPDWSTSAGSVRIAVHALASIPPRASGDAPDLAPDPSALATIPRELRVPVRVDVTSALRSWWDGSLPPGGLAVSADVEGLVVHGASAIERSSRPRLEVVVR